jgi:mono/diheme cytochrome c family protein
MSRAWWVTNALVWCVLMWAPLRSQPGGAQTAAPRGSDLFRTYCASCHGVTGQGNGPLADALRRRPSDLTQIAAGNGGVFPSARVHRIVDGRDVVSHGDPEMPVWGDAFKTSRDGFSEASVKARIAAIVQYLESIQRRQAE